MPETWQVVVADVERSTAAILGGRYKQVNLVGAATIVAVLNAVHPLRVPFVFGGDGATLCVQEACAGPVGRALLATQQMARREFDLALRVGLVPVREILAAGRQVMVARYRVSEHYSQALFTGGGIAFAEACVKDEQRGRRFRLEPGDASPAGQFQGLECRWDDIPSPHGETVTLVVRAVLSGAENRAAVYGAVIARIRDLYGEADITRPVRLEGLRLTRSARRLAGEVGVHSSGRGRLFRTRYWLRLGLQMAVGAWVCPRSRSFGGVDWGQYQRDLVANTDCRKFDDLLRQVLSGRPEQRAELTAFLEERFARGELVYGLHAARSAMMTCLVFNRQGEHVHFVDGTDGGYAVAALRMKERLGARVGAGSGETSAILPGKQEAGDRAVNCQE